MKYKDYYTILGLERSASADEIKKAYRKLARKYHPDVSKESNAEEQFKEVQEAYEVLKDPEKRKAYDQLGSHRPGQEFRPPPEWEQQFAGARGGFSQYGDIDFGDLFAELFVGRPGPRRGRGASFAAPGQDYEVSVQLSLEEASRGTEVNLELSVPEYGADGSLRRVPKAVQVRVPKGVTDGQRMRVPGKGGPGVNGGRNGDLYLNISLRSHPMFKPSGHDLYLELPVTPWEAALGTTVEVPTLDGKVRLKIASASRAGQKLRLAGRGLPQPSGGAGDLYAVLQIVTPPVISEREKALFEELARVSQFDPRSHFD